jgi:hypothetical protein
MNGRIAGRLFELAILGRAIALPEGSLDSRFLPSTAASLSRFHWRMLTRFEFNIRRKI